MQYVNLTKLIAAGPASGNDSIAISTTLFRRLLVSALREKGVFDESFYLAANSDIKEAVARRSIASAAEHYYTTGYFEGRMPKKIMVDERFYLENNLDVSGAIRKKAVASAQEHFELAGFAEGRQPYEGFTLF